MKPRIILIHWNGRFGNRMHSYAYGAEYAAAFEMDFYLPSPWEGFRLFARRPCQILEDDELRLFLNQSIAPFDSLEWRLRAIDRYSQRIGRSIQIFNPDDPE